MSIKAVSANGKKKKEKFTKAFATRTKKQLPLQYERDL